MIASVCRTYRLLCLVNMKVNEMILFIVIMVVTSWKGGSDEGKVIRGRVGLLV